MKHGVAAAVVVLLGLVLLSLVLAGCAETVSIGRILADPSHWSHKTVRVQGTVETSGGAVGRGAYAVSDGTGTIWVISGRGIPSRGARVAVEGEVFEGVQILGQSFGVALREKQHRSY